MFREAIEGARRRARALMPPWRDRRAPYLVLAALLVFAAANLGLYLFHVPAVPQGLDAIRKSGRLVVLTRMAPTTYYLGTQGETGFDYEMTQSLGRAL